MAYIADLRGEHKSLIVKKMVVVRKRPIPVRVMLTPSEKKMLISASDDVGVALSVFMRMAALEAARKREADRAA